MTTEHSMQEQARGALPTAHSVTVLNAAMGPRFLLRVTTNDGEVAVQPFTGQDDVLLACKLCATRLKLGVKK